jgi:hypothetical protein
MAANPGSVPNSCQAANHPAVPYPTAIGAGSVLVAARAQSTPFRCDLGATALALRLWNYFRAFMTHKLERD